MGISYSSQNPLICMLKDKAMKTRPDYKNWMPLRLLFWMGAVTLLSLSSFLLFGCFGAGIHEWLRWVLGIVSGMAFLVCGVATLLFAIMRKAFDYNGRRQLSRQIIHGVAGQVSLPDGGTGLDVGCGSGALTIACAKRNPAGRMIGVDTWGREYSSYSQALCQSNAAAEGVTNISFRKGNAVKLDFPDESFDAVTSNYVYHNIPSKDRRAILLETLRVLKKGGVFAIHDLFDPFHYGKMDPFLEKLKGLGFEHVELIDTTGKFFRSPREARRLFLGSSKLLFGRK